MPLTNYKNRNEKYSARANSNSENLLITKVVKELKFQAHYVEKTIYFSVPNPAAGRQYRYSTNYGRCLRTLILLHDRHNHI